MNSFFYFAPIFIFITVLFRNSYLFKVDNVVNILIYVYFKCNLLLIKASACKYNFKINMIFFIHIIDKKTFG